MHIVFHSEIHFIFTFLIAFSSFGYGIHNFRKLFAEYTAFKYFY